MLDGRFKPWRLVLGAWVAACGGSSIGRGHADGGAAAGASAGTGVQGGPAGSGVGATAGSTLGGSAGTDVSTTGGVGGGDSGGAGVSGAGTSGGAGTTTVQGCAPDALDRCNPGPGQICNTEGCFPGSSWDLGILERGGGTICKYQPDAQGPDFACLDGEWCQNEIRQCRWGTHPGCQLGERCVPCEGADCAPGDYLCQRDIACTAENLDLCAAEPGQLCAAGALRCDGATACPTADASDGLTLCRAAANGCCAAAHWCFDGRECRCGSHPACADGEACALDGIGFYACRPR